MKKILIAYFSHSGNTRFMADLIKEKVGGDVFEIKTAEPYPSEYNEVVEKARKEQNADVRPKLTALVHELNDYDVVFLGYPNWWATMPMGVFTFLESANWSGKEIVPFCTHEGSGLGRSVGDIRKLCQGASVLDGLAIRGGSVHKAQSEVSAWLKKLGLS